MSFPVTNRQRRHIWRRCRRCDVLGRAPRLNRMDSRSHPSRRIRAGPETGTPPPRLEVEVFFALPCGRCHQYRPVTVARALRARRRCVGSVSLGAMACPLGFTRGPDVRRPSSRAGTSYCQTCDAHKAPLGAPIASRPTWTESSIIPSCCEPGRLRAPKPLREKTRGLLDLDALPGARARRATMT